jgi:thiol:disulfide interchange protein DsbD
LGNCFRIVGIISSSVTKFPKSGGWMNTVKVVLGFIELALALKFLSKADLVSKTFLLKRTFCWNLDCNCYCISIYLFGKIRFPHDDKNLKSLQEKFWEF